MDTENGNDTSTIAEITSLINTIGATGLTVWSNVTNRPIITGQAGGSPVPIASAQSSLSLVLVLAVVALGVFMLAKD